MDKHAILERVINDIRAINISSIIGSDINLMRKAGNFKGLCPFHNDHNIGSFVVSDKKGIFKCFSCKTGGDGIKYYALRNGLNYVESSIELGLKLSLLSEEEYAFLTKRKFSSKSVSKIEKFYTDKDMEQFKSFKANNDVLNRVYTIFSNINEKKLSDEHLKHLKDERFLSDEEIIDDGYFTFPTRRVLKSFLKKINENFKDEGELEVLKTVPGFFFDKNKNNFSFSYNAGIGIPIKNALGLIVGIQIRLDDKDKGRYIWFSSAFANEKEYLEFGTGSGSPIDVIIPGKLLNKTIFITEGRFKARAIAKKFGSVALSVQGVCTWRGIIKEIKSLQNLYNNLFTHVYVAYDADMAYNPSVYEQALHMTNELSKYFNDITYVMWDTEFGKGIDDIIYNGKMPMIDKMDKLNFDNYYQKFMTVIKEKYPDVRTQKIPKEVLKDYFDGMVLAKFIKYAG